MATLIDTLSTSGAETCVVIGDTLFARDDLAKVKTLHAYASGGAAQYYATPRELGGSAGYQVPTGKKFIVVAVQVYSNAGAAGDSIGLQTATSDVGFASAVEPTGADLPALANSAWWDLGNGTVSTSEVNRKATLPDRTILRVVPEGRYLFLALNSATSYHVRIYGFEIDANATTI